MAAATDTRQWDDRAKNARSTKTRVFLGSYAGVGERVELPAGDAHHIFKVLRARDGDIIGVVNPDRSLMLAEVRGDARRAEAGVLEELSAPEPSPAPVTLYQAVPKGKHMDLVVEKATELGVERVVPLLTEHGEVRPSGEKSERWRRLVEAAARQSLQLRVPEVSEPESLREAFEALAQTGERGVMLHNGPGLDILEEVLQPEKPAGLFVGPEGGWSQGELSLAAGLGLKTAQMGPYRLRAETAGVVAVARAEARLRSFAEGVVNRNDQRTRTE